MWFQFSKYCVWKLLSAVFDKLFKNYYFNFFHVQFDKEQPQQLLQPR